jgi:hypothetical protein
MVRDAMLRYPILEVSVSGNSVDRRPGGFTLITDQGYPHIMAQVTYPADAGVGSAGDAIVIVLIEQEIGDEQKTTLFTGAIYDVKTRGAYRAVYLTDGYKKLHDARIINAYRKESAKNILQDILGAAGIAETAVTCPAVELARFSTDRISAARSITLLIKTLEQRGITGLRFFFDADNIFHFGTDADTGKNEGIEIRLETGKNIIKTGDGWVETLPLPVRHSQTVILNGAAMETTRTELTISGSHSRLRLWVKEA